MIEIEIALSIYMDMLSAEKSISLEYFESNMSPSKYKEFIDTIPTIAIYKSVKETEKFQTLFDKLNKAKEEMYSLQKVANFKKDNAADSIKAQEELDRIFNEEFDDDKS